MPLYLNHDKLRKPVRIFRKAWPQWPLDSSPPHKDSPWGSSVRLSPFSTTISGQFPLKL